MNELQTFKNEEFGAVRTVQIDNEVWFVGKDVAEILGYSNPRKAILDHVDAEDKGVTKCDTLGGTQELTVINESGLYSLVLSSKLPDAKKFKRWVTNEVLPQIRKTGSYHLPQTYKEALQELLLKVEENEKLTAKIEEDKPKTIFADAVSTSHTSILVGDLAKIIRQNGYEIGQNRLFEWLRINGYLIKSGTSRNMPTQRYVEQGLFRIKESTYTDKNGCNVTTKTPVVTGKGQMYFINLFLNFVEGHEK